MYGGQVKRYGFRVPAIMVAGVLLVCSRVLLSHGYELLRQSPVSRTPPELRLFDYTGFRDPATWGLLNGHDPSVIRIRNRFWYAY